MRDCRQRCGPHRCRPKAACSTSIQRLSWHWRRRGGATIKTAIIGHVTCTQPQPGWAWERFTEEGPLALLPHEEHGVQGYALVWCCPPEQPCAGSRSRGRVRI
jgi:2-polyprenyl-6-methoxyphenol hydroxylase-like FAD-dependent oxidoreductase